MLQMTMAKIQNKALLIVLYVGSKVSRNHFSPMKYAVVRASRITTKKKEKEGWVISYMMGNHSKFEEPTKKKEKGAE